MANITSTLIEEQNQILRSTEKKILVIAGPGSGKTYTLTNKILENYKDKDGFIAISFTRDASSQLRNILSRSIANENLNENFIGTIDSFVIDIIKLSYKFIEKKNLKEFEIQYAKKNEKYIMEADTSSEAFKSYLRNWKDKLNSGVIVLSFAMYIYARKALNEKLIVDYLKYKYKYIYIDEAQDLNKWQYFFFNRLIDTCDLNSIFVGDDKQGIYQFRGSKSKYFLELEAFGYKKYTIESSARCPIEILTMSKNYFYNKKGTINTQDIIYINNQMNYESIKHTNSNMFLASTNQECLEVYNLLTKNEVSNVKYIKRLDTSELTVSEEEKLISVLTYAINNILSQENIENTRHLHRVEEQLNFDNFIEYRANILSIRTNEELFELIEKEFSNSNNIIAQLNKDEYYNYFDLNENVNRVMTIHQSKGLEAENVYVKVGSDFSSRKEEIVNKYFVAFTRSKQKLYLSIPEKQKKELLTYIKGDEI